VLFVLAAATLNAVPERDVIRRGMTREDVRAALGPPTHVARQLLFRRHIEQWHYDDPPRTIEFNGVRGEEPYVLQVRND
jgi:hypothetical protein